MPNDLRTFHAIAFAGERSPLRGDYESESVRGTLLSRAPNSSSGLSEENERANAIDP